MHIMFTIDNYCNHIMFTIDNYDRAFKMQVKYLYLCTLLAYTNVYTYRNI